MVVRTAFAFGATAIVMDLTVPASGSATASVICGARCCNDAPNITTTLHCQLHRESEFAGTPSPLGAESINNSLQLFLILRATQRRILRCWYQRQFELPDSSTSPREPARREFAEASSPQTVTGQKKPYHLGAPAYSGDDRSHRGSALRRGREQRTMTQVSLLQWGSLVSAVMEGKRQCFAL